MLLRISLLLTNFALNPVIFILNFFNKVKLFEINKNLNKVPPPLFSDFHLWYNRGTTTIMRSTANFIDGKKLCENVYHISCQHFSMDFEKGFLGIMHISVLVYKKKNKKNK